MDFSAKLTSKGQITLPKALRDSMDLKPGDRVIFRSQGAGAVMAKTPDFLELAGSIPVPPAARNATVDDLKRAAARAWASRH